MDCPCGTPALNGRAEVGGQSITVLRLLSSSVSYHRRCSLHGRSQFIARVPVVYREQSQWSSILQQVGSKDSPDMDIKIYEFEDLTL